jgi:hypothetical protein
MSASSLSASIRDVRTLLLSPPPPPQLPRNVAELLTRVAEHEQFVTRTRNDRARTAADRRRDDVEFVARLNGGRSR